MISTILSKLGGRKFIFAVLLMPVAFFIDRFTMYNFESPFIDYLVYIYGIYVAGDAVCHISRALTPVRTRNRLSKTVVDHTQNIKDVLLYNEAILKGIEENNKNMGLLVDYLHKGRKQ